MPTWMRVSGSVAQCLCASFDEGDRGVGSVFVRGQDCVLWLVLALRYVVKGFWIGRS